MTQTLSNLPSQSPPNCERVRSAEEAVEAAFASVPVKSWLDPTWSRVLGAALGEALARRFESESGKMVTLTYDHSKWPSPIALYRAQSAERHVRRFIERLAARLDRDLTGRWLCKMEFQRGGWVHFHIALRVEEFVPKDVFADCWGHGFTDVRQMTPRLCWYFAKYIAKGENVASFLHLERPRSIKVVRVSPGFWEGIRETRTRVVDREKPRPRGDRCYIPIGVYLRKDPGVVLRCTRSGAWRRAPVTFGVAVAIIEAMGLRVKRSGKWLGVELRLDDLAQLLGREEWGAWMRDRAGAGSARTGPPFDLNQCGNPPSGDTVMWVGDVIACMHGWREDESGEGP